MTRPIPADRLATIRQRLTFEDGWTVWDNPTGWYREDVAQLLDEVDRLAALLDATLSERLAADGREVDRAALAATYPQASDPRVRRWLAPQPEPTGEGRRVTEWLLGYLGDDEPLLCDVILHRRVQGIQRYGTELRCFSGRNADCDALQEAVDLCLYLAQSVMEHADDDADALPRHRMEIATRLAAELAHEIRAVLPDENLDLR